MKLNPYLNFDGRCEEAFRVYEKCLGGRILLMMTYGESPMGGQTEPGWRGKIMHTTLAVGDQILQGADAPPGRYQKPQGIAVTIGLSDQAEAERIFAALAENGVVEFPLQETFWAVRFGMVTDRFRIPWMINCEKPA